MLVKHYLVICFSLFLVACNSVSDKSYKASKETMLEKESNDPLHFLSISHTDKRNMLGQTVVRGVIKNNATVASFKNVRIKILYFNAEGKQVTNHEEVVDEIVKPNNEVKFRAKYFTPKGTDSVALSIMRAEVVEEEEEKRKTE